MNQYNLIEMVLPYGIFAVLFVWLLYTTNKRNETREIMYQETIKKNQLIIAEQAKSFSSLSGDISGIRILIESK